MTWNSSKRSSIDSKTTEGTKRVKMKFLVLKALFLAVAVSAFVAYEYDTLVGRSLPYINEHNKQREKSQANGLRKVEHLVAHALYAQNASGNPETIEVSYPYVVQPGFEFVAQETVVDHVFGQSYGTPFVANYTPPEGVKFNKVVATLNTSVAGVQFNRLAHLFFNGVEIWRTSTIEPGGTFTVSSFSKDISDYSVLFKDKGTLSFELNNNVDSRYTGSFHIVLSLAYYFDPSVEEFEKKYDSVQDLLQIGSEPTKILPLGNGAKNLIKPEVFLPTDSFNASVPHLNSNTSNVRLSLFTSGNADEEFWYTNLLDQNTNYFGDQGLLGHGPARIVEVYINGKLFFTQSPDPVIFTGGISPSFWSPVVSSTAFDLRSINFDLTPILPILQDAEITIRIDNGVDHKPVGSNWITTANLHIWEDDEILGVSGKASANVQDRACIPISIKPSSSNLTQIITCKTAVEVNSELTYLTSQSGEVSGAITYSTVTKDDNVQIYEESANDQGIARAGTTEKTITVDKQTIWTESFAYPLYLEMDVSTQDSDTNLDVIIATSKNHQVEAGSLRSSEISNQNGTSLFTQSPNGNHGTGSLDTNYQYSNPKSEPPFYQRHVEARRNQIVVDNGNFVNSFDSISDFFAARGDQEVVDLLQSHGIN